MPPITIITIIYARTPKMKFNAIKNKTIPVSFEYFGDTINLEVLVNFLTPEVESKLLQLSDVDENEKMSNEDRQKRTDDFAEVVSLLVRSWDIEDAEPTKENFILLGIQFMSAAFGSIQLAILPDKKKENN